MSILGLLNKLVKKSNTVFTIGKFLRMDIRHNDEKFLNHFVRIKFLNITGYSFGNLKRDMIKHELSFTASVVCSTELVTHDD